MTDSKKFNLKFKTMETVAQKLESLKIEEIKQVYQGKNTCCRCGCKGKYVTPDDNEKAVKTAVSKAKKLVESGEYNKSESDVEHGCINIVFGNDRAITIYYLKK